MGQVEMRWLDAVSMLCKNIKCTCMIDLPKSGIKGLPRYLKNHIFYHQDKILMTATVAPPMLYFSFFS